MPVWGGAVLLLPRFPVFAHSALAWFLTVGGLAILGTVAVVLLGASAADAGYLGVSGAITSS